MEPKLIWLLVATAVLAGSLLLAAIADIFRTNTSEVAARPSGALVHIAAPGLMIVLLPAIGYAGGLKVMWAGLAALAISAAMLAKRRTEDPVSIHGAAYAVAFIATLLLTAISFRLLGFVMTTLADLSVSASHAIWGAAALTGLLLLCGGLRLSRYAVLLQSVTLALMVIGLFAAFLHLGSGSIVNLNQTLALIKSQLPSALADAGLSNWIGQINSNDLFLKPANWPPILLVTASIAAAGLAAMPVLRGPRIRARVSASRIMLLGLNWGLLLAMFALVTPLLGLSLGTSTMLAEADEGNIGIALAVFLAEQGTAELGETRGGTLSLVPFLWNAWTDAAPWAVGILGASVAATIVCGRLRTLLAYTHTIAPSRIVGRIIVAVGVIASAWLAARLQLSALPGLFFLTLAIALQAVPNFIKPGNQAADLIAASIGVVIVLGVDPVTYQMIGIPPLVDTRPLAIHSGIWGLTANLIARAVLAPILGRAQTHSA